MPVLMAFYFKENKTLADNFTPRGYGYREKEDI
jgi:hypothetical protein